MSERASIYITSILSDNDVRRRALGYRTFLDFPFDVALKTGTSKDYRDAWTVGFINGYAVGVWTGNFNGTSMHKVSGAWGAGRIFHQVVRTLAGSSRPEFLYSSEYKKVQLCRKDGKAAYNGCEQYTELLHHDDIRTELYADDTENQRVNIQQFVRIEQPSRGEEFILNPLYDETDQPVPVRIVLQDGNEALYSLIVDGEYVLGFNETFSKGIVFSRGEHTIMVSYNDSVVDEVYFTIR